MINKENDLHEAIAAVVLAAGRSTRMGRPKMVLPWGNTTIIGRVISVLVKAGITRIHVVTGGNHEGVENALHNLDLPVTTCLKTVFNPSYAEGEMLSSFQAGLASLGEIAAAALVVLGDQPQIEGQVVRAVVGAYRVAKSPLVIPSVRMRRGHPWLIDRSLWPEIMALRAPQTLRDFQSTHTDRIQYVVVETESILMDLDTPEAYHLAQPGENKMDS